MQKIYRYFFYYFIPFSIICVGTFLRLYRIDYQSFWSDELYSVMISDQNNASEVLKDTIQLDVHPPLYYLLLHYSMGIVGKSDLGVRLISAVAGILSIPVMYFLVLKLFSRFEAIVASSLLAVSLGPVYYSQEARFYSLVLLFTLISTGFLITILERIKTNGPPVLWAFGYFISIVALIYIHYYGLFILAFHFSIMVLQYIKSRNSRLLKFFLLSIFIIFIAYTPWLPSLFYQITHNASEGSWIESPSIKTLQSFMALNLIPFDRLSIVALAMIGIYFARVMVIIFQSLSKKKPVDFPTARISEDVFVILWILIPVIIVLTISAFKPILSARYLVIIFAPVYIILGRFFRLVPLSLPKQVFLAALFVLYVFSGFLRLHYYTDPCSEPFSCYLCKQQVRDAVKYIIDNNEEGQESVIYTCLWSENDVNYYFEQFGVDFRVSKNICEIPDMENLDNSNTNTIWFVQGYFRQVSPKIQAAFVKEFPNLEIKDFYKITVERYER